VRLPPNADLDAESFVKAALLALAKPDDPLPDAGYRVLLRSSSKRWREFLCNSIGAPQSSTENDMVRHLSESSAHTHPHPQNPYSVLVGVESDEPYNVGFPSSSIDFKDGSCWLECQITNPITTQIIASMMWYLERRVSDGAWLIDWIDWNDHC